MNTIIIQTVGIVNKTSKPMKMKYDNLQLVKHLIEYCKLKENTNMFSRDANYDMSKAVSEIEIKRLLLDVKVETQVILQLLVKHSIIKPEEVQEMRQIVKSSRNYRSLYDYLDKAQDIANYYNDNPQEHLKELLRRKFNGENI